MLDHKVPLELTEPPARQAQLVHRVLLDQLVLLVRKVK